MTQQPHEVIWTLTNAVVVSSGIHVVAELGVADHIGAEPINVTELASRCGADPDALDRVLRLLATHGVFSDVGGAYDRAPHPVASTLRAGPVIPGPSSLNVTRVARDRNGPGGLWT